MHGPHQLSEPANNNTSKAALCVYLKREYMCVYGTLLSRDLCMQLPKTAIMCVYMCV